MPEVGLLGYIAESKLIQVVLINRHVEKKKHLPLWWLHTLLGEYVNLLKQSNHIW